MPDNSSLPIQITASESASTELESLINSYKNAKSINNATVIIDNTDFNLFGNFDNNNFNFLNERTITINTNEYNDLSSAQFQLIDPEDENITEEQREAQERQNILYELWHNPHITWILRENRQWNSIEVESININDNEETLTISFLSRTNNT